MSEPLLVCNLKECQAVVTVFYNIIPEQSSTPFNIIHEFESLLEQKMAETQDQDLVSYILDPENSRIG